MTAVLALTVVALPFVITPGASFTLTVAHAHPSQTPAWRRIALGTSVGLLVIASLVGVTGLGVFLISTPALRVGLGLVGAAVLIAYGATICARAFRVGGDHADSAVTAPDPTASDRASPDRLVRWSFLMVLTNPKALALYVLIVPTLARPGLDGLALLVTFAAIHICLQSAWLCLIHNGVVRIPALARDARLRRRLLGAAGGLMIVLGILALLHTLN